MTHNSKAAEAATAPASELMGFASENPLLNLFIDCATSVSSWYNEVTNDRQHLTNSVQQRDIAMTANKSQNKAIAAPNTSAHDVVASHLYLDTGNSAVKFSFGSGVQTVRSIYVQLDQPIVGTTASPCISFSGKHYLVGASAQHTGKVVKEFAAADSKLQNLFLALFSTLRPAYNGYRWNLSLTLLLPFGTSKSVQDSFRKQLTSKVWQYTWNGLEASVEVTEVYFVNEGIGSYNVALAEGQINKEELVLVLDLGGGTCIARQMLGGAELWSAVFSNCGAVQLASRIATSAQAKIGTVPNIYEVIDALVSGSLKLRGVNIESDYKRERKAWFQSLLQQVSYQMRTQGLSPSTRILLTGGGALLAVDEVTGQDKFVICKNAATANIIGAAPDFTHNRQQSE